MNAALAQLCLAVLVLESGRAVAGVVTDPVPTLAAILARPPRALVIIDIAALGRAQEY